MKLEDGWRGDFITKDQVIKYANDPDNGYMYPIKLLHSVKSGQIWWLPEYVIDVMTPYKLYLADILDIKETRSNLRLMLNWFKVKLWVKCVWLIMWIL